MVRVGEKEGHVNRQTYILKQNALSVSVLLMTLSYQIIISKYGCVFLQSPSNSLPRFSCQMLFQDPWKLPFVYDRVLPACGMEVKVPNITYWFPEEKSLIVTVQLVLNCHWTIIPSRLLNFLCTFVQMKEMCITSCSQDGRQGCGIGVGVRVFSRSRIRVAESFWARSTPWYNCVYTILRFY